MVEGRTPEREVGGFDPHSGLRVVSLSKIHYLQKSTGNTQKAVAPSRHDRKIVYWDVKRNIWFEENQEKHQIFFI